MIEVYLCGRLREYGPPCGPVGPTVVRVGPTGAQWVVGDLLAGLSIPRESVGDVYRDGTWDYRDL